MKNIFFASLFMVVLATKAQSAYEEIALPNNSTFLLGNIGMEQLKMGSYGLWFNTQYENYSADTSLIDRFKVKLSEHHLLLFLGTWCGDSKREVPRILKILDLANFPKERLTMVALDRRKDRYKQGPNGEEKGWDIKRVPTLILVKNTSEVNRIVERPVDTLEEDLLAILCNLDYTPNYTN